MSEKYVPRHRAPGKHRAEKPKRALRTGVLLTSVAVAATGVSVYGGVIGNADQSNDLKLASVGLQAASAVESTPTSVAASTPATPSAAKERTEVVTRSDRRSATDPAKVAALSTDDGKASMGTEDLADADPREIAKALLGEYGFSADQFGCLDQLYVSESNWRIDADNPSSSAYGIPQALVATHDMPAGYMTSAEVQIRWGLDYIASRYGTPCNAWSFKASHNWY